MNKLKLLAFVLCQSIAFSLPAQTWQNIGPADNTSAFPFGTSNYAAALDYMNNTIYIAYVDMQNSGKVTVKKYSSGTWVTVGTAGASTNAATEIAMAIDSATSTPYVTYTNGGSIYMMQYSSGSWTNISASISSVAGYLSMVVDKTGVPFVGYLDAGGSNRYVKKYTSGGWTTVGAMNQGSSGVGGAVYLAIDRSNSDLYLSFKNFGTNVFYLCKYTSGSWTEKIGGTTISAFSTPYVSVKDGSAYIFYCDNASGASTLQKYTSSLTTLSTGFAGGTYLSNMYSGVDKTNTPYMIYTDANGKATVMKYNGSSSVNVGSTGFSNKSATPKQILLDTAGTPFAIFGDGINGICIKQYNGSNWVTYGNSELTGISSNSATFTSITADKDNTPYLSYQESNINADSVKKYDGANWTIQGSLTRTLNFYPSVASDTAGVIYKAYRNASNKLSVVKYSSGSWVQVGTDGFSASSVNVASITTDIYGVPYVAYSDGNSSNKVSVMKFNGSSWVQVGSAGFSAAGVSSYLSLSFSINNTPFVAYKQSTDSKLSVMSFDGTAWSLVGSAGISTSNADHISIAVDSANKPYVAYIDGGASTRPTVKYYNGTSWATVGSAGFSTNNFCQYTSIVIDPYTNTPYVAYKEGSPSPMVYVKKYDGSAWVNLSGTNVSAGTANYIQLVLKNYTLYLAYCSGSPRIKKYELGKLWVGSTGTNWNTAGNWAPPGVPSSSDLIVIPSNTTNLPTLTTGSSTTSNINIISGATLNLAGSTALNVTGTFINNGTIAGAGKVALTGSSAQIISGTGSISNLELNNSNGATISGMLNITDSYTPTNGILTTGGNLVLKSTATSTGRIAQGSPSGGYISGNLQQERYTPGKRAFRFLSHPFTTSLPMSALTDDLDITGSGGSPFTTTSLNNPSAFYFDVTTADNSTGGNNPGWVAFTSSDSWAPYQVMRVLVRGAKGQGLTAASYTPTNNTLDVAATVNQGDITVNLTKGSGTNFVLVGNPFPSQVNMDAVATTNVGSSFYIWDATQGLKGGYTSYTFGSSSFNLPSCGAFATTLSANGSIVFEEADKTGSASGTMFKPTAAANTVQLRLEDSTTFWDRLLLRFDDNAMATVDYPDATKLYNPDMSFYTWSKDDSMLSIDARPYAEETIKLGLYSTLKKNFRIIAADFKMPSGTKLFLHDKYLNKTEEITGAGYEYWFAVDTNAASWGDNRFELSTEGKPTNNIIPAESQLKIKLVPNPATDKVTVYYDGLKDGNLNIGITNMMGVKVAEVQQASNKSGSVSIPLQNIANGIYIITIQNGKQIFTQKLIKN